MRFEIDMRSTGSKIKKLIFRDVDRPTSAGSPDHLDILVQWAKDGETELLGEITKQDIRRLGKAV